MKNDMSKLFGKVMDRDFLHISDVDGAVYDLGGGSENIPEEKREGFAKFIFNGFDCESYDFSKLVLRAYAAEAADLWCERAEDMPQDNACSRFVQRLAATKVSFEYESVFNETVADCKRVLENSIESNNKDEVVSWIVPARAGDSADFYDNKVVPYSCVERVDKENRIFKIDGEKFYYNEDSWNGSCYLAEKEGSDEKFNVSEIALVERGSNRYERIGLVFADEPKEFKIDDIFTGHFEQKVEALRLAGSLPKPAHFMSGMELAFYVKAAEEVDCMRVIQDFTGEDAIEFEPPEDELKRSIYVSTTGRYSCVLQPENSKRDAVVKEALTTYYDIEETGNGFIVQPSITFMAYEEATGGVWVNAGLYDGAAKEFDFWKEEVLNDYKEVGTVDKNATFSVTPCEIFTEGYEGIINRDCDDPKFMAMIDKFGIDFQWIPYDDENNNALIVFNEDLSTFFKSASEVVEEYERTQAQVAAGEKSGRKNEGQER